MPALNYREALEYFRDRSDYDRGFISNPFAGDNAAADGLRRTRALLDSLGSPDRAYPIIHVAGTKGKGSTCAFIESIARQAGLKTGLFVTPHLHSVRERIQIDGEPVSEDVWSTAMSRVAARIAETETAHPELGRITAFELNTALALLIMARAGVELGTVEVGLGGRLDATNVIEPRVTVITPVSYDHQAILGETLREIASEKAGIIKPGVPVVIASQPPEAREAITARASALGAPMLVAGEHWTAAYDAGLVTLTGPWGEFAGLHLGLDGQHQSLNAGVALMALWQFSHDLFATTETVITGLASVRWPGRFERVNASPTVIVDGAHNGASMEVLAAALSQQFPDRTFIFVFGSYKDKDLAAMLAPLKPLARTLIATRSASPRARSPQEVRSAAASLGIPIIEQGSIGGALRLALDTAEPDDVIVATGSLSIVAETREYFGLATVSPDEREILSS